MSVETLRSYLVGLGFSVDTRSYRQFNTVLADAARSVKKETASIGFDLLKWQVAVTGVFVGISSSIVGMMDKIALADQDYRLFGERMFLTTQNARNMKIALDALGQPLEAIAFDPELHGRYVELQKRLHVMNRGLGGDFETNMRKIRDFDFELRSLRVELQFLAMGIVNEIFKGLFGGSEDILTRIKSINNYIIQNIPRWSKQFATYVIPILKDTKDILKSSAQLLGIFGMEFANVIGVISGDDSLKSAAFDFDKFARAIGKVVHGLALMLETLVKLEKYLPIVEAIGGAGIGALVGSVVPGVGTGAGALIGGIGGATLGLLGKGSTGSGISPEQAVGHESMAIADRAKQLALQVSKQTGIAPDIIFSQWAHETGYFTNRGAKSLNNLAGIRKGTDYRSFNSLEDFANYYSKLITSQRYTSKGILSSKTTDQFASALKAGGYYEDTLQNYQKGMRNFDSKYSQGQTSTTQVTVGDINIMQPNASPEQIKRSVLDAVDQASKKQMQRNLTELSPIYQ